MEENLMNYKIIMNYAYDEMKKASVSAARYEEAVEFHKIAKNEFIAAMNLFCKHNFINISFDKI
jgi:hypothetical protein